MTDHQLFDLPPNNANPEITLPLQSMQDISMNMKRFRLSAGDVETPVDWRKKAKLCPVKNQAKCGNCWAMSSTSALADKFIIHKKIKGLNLDPVLVTQCSPGRTNNGCCGSMPASAGHFFEENGTAAVSGDCPDFAATMTAFDIKEAAACTPAGQTVNFPNCHTISTKCKAGNPIMFKAAAGSTRTVTGNDPSNTIYNMKLELQNGPYVVVYNVPYDFMASGWGYKWDKTGGVYVHGAYDKELDEKYKDKKGHIQDWKQFAGWHAVELVGWGKDADIKNGKGATTPYWIIKNSWGDKWAEDGYCRIAMNLAENGNLNAGLGLDIPKRIPTGGLMGGGTTFDIDKNSGVEDGYVYKDVKEGWCNSKINWKWIIFFIFCLIIAVFFLYRKKG